MEHSMQSTKTQDFINKSIKIHGDKYDYSQVEYINNKSKVKILCKVHGVFDQTPHNHIVGNNCPKCSQKTVRTQQEFIDKAIKVHSYRYDYSQVEYINCSTKVKIICKIHGVFEQKPQNHLFGSNCQKCHKTKLRTSQQFIDKAIKKHGDRYDYSQVQYINSSIKVKIICKVHGVFDQNPKNHIYGNGCKSCAMSNTTSQFIDKAIQIHGDKYDYSQVDYVNCLTKVKILCKIHGVFEQNPKSHLDNHGCQNCVNKSESILYEFLKEQFNVEQQKTFDWLIYKKQQRLDFYLSDLNICVECQGLQHFENIKYFKNNLDQQQQYDINKEILLQKNNISVIYIYQLDIFNNQNDWKNKLLDAITTIQNTDKKNWVKICIGKIWGN